MTASMKRVVPIIATLLPIALLAVGLALKSPNQGIDQALADGRAPRPPSFELTTLQEGQLEGTIPAIGRSLGDGRLRFEELRGSPVVLNYWASWCNPCRDEAPLLERAWQRSKEQGVMFLGLNMQDLTGDARRFMREFGVSYPNVRDPTDKVAREWGVTGLPETFFIDADGRVVGHVIGVVDQVQLAAGIRAAKSGKPLRVGEGGDRRSVR